MQEKNGRFIYFVNKLADMVIVSVLWGACSLPLVTVGAATAALYHSVVKSVREDHAYAAASFLASFRMNLKQCACLTGGAAVCILIFGSAAYGLHSSPGSFLTNAYLIFAAACMCLIILAQLHAYFLIGRFDIRGRDFWKVLLRLCGGAWGMNIMLLAMLLFAVELVVYCPPLALFVPAGTIYVLSFAEEKQFQKYIRVSG